MTKLIEKARTASTEALLEMAMVLKDASVKEGMMARTAVMVALEERIGSEAFDAFCDAME